MKLSKEDVMKMFDISAVTVHNWCKKGLPKGYDVMNGKRRMVFDYSEVVEWAGANKKRVINSIEVKTDQ